MEDNHVTKAEAVEAVRWVAQRIDEGLFGNGGIEIEKIVGEVQDELDNVELDRE